MQAPTTARYRDTAYNGPMELEPAAPPLPQPHRADPYHTYLDSLRSTESRRTMRGCLDRIARIITDDDTATGAGQPWHLLRYPHTTALHAAMLNKGWSASHINKHLVALRQVLKTAWKLDLISTDDYRKAIDINSVTTTRLPRGQHIPAEAIAAALRACDADTSPAGRRDAAIIAVLYSTGCRRAELAGLRLTDYDRTERSLTIIGKGDKQRLVHLNTAAQARLDTWVSTRGATPGALFPPISRGGRIRTTAHGPATMSGQAIADLLARRLPSGDTPITPHDFRRTFIGELLDAGVDLATTQQIAGHSSPATTARYDRRPLARRRDAVDRLTLPE